MSDPRYPIGKFTFDGPPDAERRKKFIDDIEQTPAALRAAVRGLTPAQIETPYRDGGWTVRQVTHHVPESHMNAYIRFKLALLDSLHDRWVRLLRALQPEEWKRPFHHPELGNMPLEKNLALYSWHGRHHVAHITELRNKMGW